MDHGKIGHNRPDSKRLHPYVHRAILFLALVFALSTWLFFHSSAQDGLSLLVVSAFLFLTTVLTSKMFKFRRLREGREISSRGSSFREWASGQFQTYTGRIKSYQAAIEILLPLTAGALGLLTFAILAHFELMGA